MNNLPKLGVQHLRGCINQPNILVNNVILLLGHQNIQSVPFKYSVTDTKESIPGPGTPDPPECRSKTCLCIWNNKYTVLIQTLPSTEQTCHLLNLLLPFVPAKHHSTPPPPLSKNHKNCTVFLVPPASAAFTHTHFKTSLLN